MEPRDYLEASLEVLDAAHQLREALNKHALSAVGLTIEQACALCRIDMAGGTASVSQLAAHLSRTENATTTLLGKLVRNGHLYRERSQTGDKRVVYVRLTPQGEMTLSQFRSELMGMFQKIADPPSPASDLLLAAQSFGALLAQLSP